MPMFVLDTNVVSELRRNRPHGAVVAWVKSVPASSLHIAAVTAGEIQAGIELTRDGDAMKAGEIEAWLEGVLMSANILDANADVFRIWAKLMHHRPDHHIEDALIAATALHFGMSVATRNSKDFNQFGVSLLNPFGFESA